MASQGVDKKMSATISYVQEAGVRRRWHPHDVMTSQDAAEGADAGSNSMSAPSVHNSLAIQKKHVWNVYR